MKKLTFGWLLLSAFGCFLVSCQKEAIDPVSNTSIEAELPPLKTEETLTEESFLLELSVLEEESAAQELLRQQIMSEISTDQLSINEGVLAFESLEYYQSIVDYGEDMSENPDGDPVEVVMDGVAEEVVIDYTRQHEFPSYGTIKGEDSEFNQEFLDAILNADRIVQIGDWLIKINPSDEKVWTVPTSNPNAYEDLLAESGDGVISHDIGDDVLYQLSNDGLAEDRGCGGIGGHPSLRRGDLIPQEIALEATVEFRRFGIYFDLKTWVEFENFTSSALNSDIHLTLQIKAPEAWRKRRPCRSRDVGTSPSGNKDFAFGKAVDWTFYSGSRSLNGYFLFARARGVMLNHPNHGFVFGFTSWAGRDVNSPH